MADVVYDVCVVGAGMIGCAAAKHLTSSQDAARKILLIGPGEPKDKNSADIFASWHDEGRITRCLDEDHSWRHLAIKSVNNYKQLEEEAGVSFYNEAGLLFMGPRNCAFISQLLKSTERLKPSPELLTHENMKEQFPYINLPTDFRGIYERFNAGHIRPRVVVGALKKLALNNGCDVVDDVVSEVKVVGDLVEIQTDSGHVYQSKRVLLTTGAFTSCRKLLPANMQPDMRLYGSTVVHIRVSEKDAKRLQSMPPYIMVKSDETNGPEREMYDIYGFPPMLYSDGHYYMKIGHRPADHFPHPETPAEIQQWYQGSADAELVQKIASIFNTHFPDINREAVVVDRCIVTKTPTRHPYIDMMTSQLGVAIGGNGFAAKSCLELGYIAARMIAEGEWSYSELSADLFKFKARQN